LDKITWTNSTRKLSELIPWPRNPRQIKADQVKRLQESVEEFGQPEVIAIGPNNELYNGHQRLKAWGAKYGGDYEVEVRVASRPLTEKEREKLTVYLHKGAMGEWDFDLLSDFEVPDLLRWGFTEKELQVSGFDFGVGKNNDAEPQLDKAAELLEKWKVRPGDLWGLGKFTVCPKCGKVHPLP
jgi:hypothetical protein